MNQLRVEPAAARHVAPLPAALLEDDALPGNAAASTSRAGPEDARARAYTRLNGSATKTWFAQCLVPPI
jgi:hypothetical protein